MTAEPELIVDADRFAEVVAAMVGEPKYAVDTEFHRERTYVPKLALIQLAWADQAVLVDPFEVDLHPFAEVLDGPGVAILHAAGQDLEVLEGACNTIPSVLFDTQIAAGFLGMSSPSLASLHQSELGLSLPKGDRLTDWLRRPLREQQLTYALSDVLHLIELHDVIRARLEELDRVEWAEAECEIARSKDRSPIDPDDAWRKIREARHLRGAKLGVVSAVAAWRERRAFSSDQPVRFILPDLAVVSVAQRSPKTMKELKSCRGVEERHIRGGAGEEILDAVTVGLKLDVERSPGSATPEMPRHLRPAVPLIAAWVSQLAREVNIDSTLLATRADIEAFLRGDDVCRLNQGWRAELVGTTIGRLIGGEASVAFESGRGLVVEDRSGPGSP